MKIVQSIFVFSSILFLTSCDIDHGLGTLESKISGRIIFINHEKKPDSIEAVRVIAAVRVPPQDLGDVVFTYSSVDLSQERSEYEIPAPLSEYELVAAIFKEKGKAWNYANILGFYGFDPTTYSFDFQKVYLDKAHPVAKGIDIYCDWQFAMQ